jgi:hypothetical protein
MEKFNKTYVGTATADDGTKIDAFVNEPTYAPAQKLTKEDVWGKHEMENEFVPKIPLIWIHKGMLVATSHDDGFPSICPIWKDRLPYKSVTVVCNMEQEEEVSYWLEYVHGGGSISRRKELPDGKLALRSDYQCW